MSRSTAAVDRAGGEILLDERVRRGGSHHQKLVIIRDTDRLHRTIAFEGGIDLCHGRHDDARHRGDPQTVDIAKSYGAPSPLARSATRDLRTCDRRSRVEVPRTVGGSDAARPSKPVAPRAPPSHQAATPRQPPSTRTPDSTRARRDPRGSGPSHVPGQAPEVPVRSRRRAEHRSRLPQSASASPKSRVPGGPVPLVARRCSARLRPPFDAIPRCASLRSSLASPIAMAARRVPRRDIGRERVIDILRRAGGERVAVYDLENAEGTPIYVHAKVAVVDDLWMVIGSDNLNRRSWTHDSELSCSIIDSVRDERAPTDPAGLGNGARQLARTTRLRLWSEHLAREHDGDDDLVDPIGGFDVLARSAAALDRWHATGRQGPRPPGHLRVHREDRLRGPMRWWALTLHRLLLDPDGRPRALARDGRF